MRTLMHACLVALLSLGAGFAADYAVAKAAVAHYTRYLAQDLAPYGITANAIAREREVNRRPDITGMAAAPASSNVSWLICGNIKIGRCKWFCKEQEATQRYGSLGSQFCAFP